MTWESAEPLSGLVESYEITESGLLEYTAVKRDLGLLQTMNGRGLTLDDKKKAVSTECHLHTAVSAHPAPMQPGLSCRTVFEYYNVLCFSLALSV